MTLFFKRDTKSSFQPDSVGFGKTSGTNIFGNYKKSRIPGAISGSVKDTLGQPQKQGSIPSTKDLLKKRLAEQYSQTIPSVRTTRHNSPLLIQSNSESNTGKRYLYDRSKTPTKLLHFSCDSTDQTKFVKKANISHNRSQIFYAGRQDYVLDQARVRKPS